MEPTAPDHGRVLQQPSASEAPTKSVDSLAGKLRGIVECLAGAFSFVEGNPAGADADTKERLRGIVECLAGAFSFVEGNPAGADADTKERLRRTCCRDQRF